MSAHVEATEQRVTPLELFFDLVFVFAITRVTALMAHDLSWASIGQGLLVYALGHVPPLVVGIAMLTQPALSALLGWVYYGELLTARDWMGAALIVIALILLRLRQRGEPSLHEPSVAPS